MSVRIRRGVAGLVVAAALLAGCQPAVVAPSVVPSVVPTRSSPSPTPSPTPSLTAEQAAIKAGMLRYLEVYEKFARDPSLTDLSETQYVTTGQESITMPNALIALRERGKRVAGTISYKAFQIKELDPDGKTKRAEVTYCKDLSQYELWDIKTGQRVDASSLPKAYMETAILEVKLTGKWAVASLTNKRVESC